MSHLYKQCTHCKESKLLKEFYFYQDKPKPWCKECTKAATRSRYNKDRPKNAETIRASTEKRAARNKQFLVEYLSTRVCQDCGEVDSVVLEFDHVQGEKYKNISHIVCAGQALATLKAEIDKCEIVCANCHRRRTAARAGNWYKSLIVC